MLEFLDHCDAEGVLRNNRGILLTANTVQQALELTGLL
jgi:hypothetical protein